MYFSFLWRFLLETTIVLVVFLYFDGFTISSAYAGFMVALIIGLANALVPHLIPLFSLTVNLMTAMLFALGLNILLLQIASALLNSFEVASLEATVVPVIVISIVTWFATLTFGKTLRL